MTDEPLSFEEWEASFYGEEASIAAGESGAAYEPWFDWYNYAEKAYEAYLETFSR